MKPKIGFIQTRGMGDCIIALPITKWYSDRGYEVYLAHDERFCEGFQYAAPYCTFVPVPYSAFKAEEGIYNEYWFEIPFRLLRARGCDVIVSFPQHESIICSKPTTDKEVVRRLQHRISNPYEARAIQAQVYKHLKFDEYKYFVAQVPFKEKWNLSINRNYAREMDLYTKLVDPSRDLIVSHLEGSTLKVSLEDIQYDKSQCQLVNITSDVTSNIFDWLTIIEKADTLIMLDSVFFNLVDQLNLPNKKYFIRRSPIESTPVIGNDWEWINIEVPDRNNLFG